MLGRKPTYSSIAASEMLKPGIDTEDRFRTIADVVGAVSRGEFAWGVVPLRNNSIEGEIITDTEEAFAAHPGTLVIAKRFFPIRLTLIGSRNSNLAEIEEVCSKAQAIAQCTNWLDEHLPTAERTAMDSTSSGMQAVFADDTVALIGNSGMTTYGLKILAEDIQDNPDNATEFGVIVSADGEVDLLKSYLAEAS